MKVEIKQITGTSNSYYSTPRESVEVYVDGVLIGRGGYGGEPEDNSRTRDYYWVEELIDRLSIALGAEVTITKVVEQDED